MNIRKPVYRFFAAFLIVAVLGTTAVPAVAQGREGVKKFCSMLSGEQPMSSMSMSGSSSQQAIKTAIQRLDKGNNDSCPVEEAYLCCLNESPVAPKATPISQTISSNIVALQVVAINQQNVPFPPVSSIEQQFIEALSSSPPLFLKNSSFLN